MAAILAEPLFTHVPFAVEWLDGARVPDGVEVPFPAELVAVAAAVPVRRRAFVLGRLAAHAALRQAGAPLMPVLAGPDRAPCWPDGFVGSIAHTGDVAVAAAARAADVAAVGIDVERDRPLALELWDTVATPRERAWLDAQPARTRGRRALQLFCAKEAVYKAWYPVGRRVLEFAEVEVDCGEGAPRSARVLASPAARFELAWSRLGEHVVVAAWRSAG